MHVLLYICKVGLEECPFLDRMTIEPILSFTNTIWKQCRIQESFITTCSAALQCHYPSCRCPIPIALFHALNCLLWHGGTFVTDFGKHTLYTMLARRDNEAATVLASLVPTSFTTGTMLRDGETNIKHCQGKAACQDNN